MKLETLSQAMSARGDKHVFVSAAKTGELTCNIEPALSLLKARLGEVKSDEIYEGVTRTQADVKLGNTFVIAITEETEKPTKADVLVELPTRRHVWLFTAKGNDAPVIAAKCVLDLAKQLQKYLGAESFVKLVRGIAKAHGAAAMCDNVAGNNARIAVFSAVRGFAKALGLEATASAEVTAADDFKITCKTKLPAGADQGILYRHEGKTLRSHSSFSDITTAKLLNAYKKAIRNTITKDKYLWNDITSMQQPEPYRTTLRVQKFGATFGAPAVFTELYNVVLVNAKGKPVYSVEDITPTMELKLTKIEK